MGFFSWKKPTVMEDEKHYGTSVHCSPKTKSLLITDCKAEYLAHHPEMQGVPLSEGLILRKVVEYYLKT